MKKGKLKVLRELAASMPEVKDVNHMKRLMAVWQKDKAAGVIAYCTHVHVQNLRNNG